MAILRGRKLVNSSIPAQEAAPRGVVLNQASFSSLSDFTAIGGVNASVSTNKIALSSGASNLTRYLQYNPLTDSDEKPEITLEYTIDSSGGGLGIGKRSVNTWTPWGFTAALDHTDGKAKLYNNDGTVRATSAGSVAITVGASYRLVLTMGQTTTITAYNLTAGTSTSAIGTSNGANMGKFAFVSLGGSQSVTAWKIDRRSLVNAEYVLVGDSKTQGSGASPNTNRWANLFAAMQAKPVEVWAGGGDRTTEVLQGLSHVIAATPKKAILCIGRNDLNSGVASATWQANYQSIVSQLKAASITVIHLLPIPETTQDQSALTSWITSTYSGDTKISVATGWDNATMLADGIHPDNDGHLHIAQKVSVALSASGTVIPLTYAANREEFVGPFLSWLNAKTGYGAVGNGIADDTVALQNWLNAIPAGGGVGYLPAGTYKITSQLNMAGKIYITVVGEDPATTEIQWYGATNGTMLKLDGVAYSKYSRIQWYGRGIAGVSAYEHAWDNVGNYASTFNEHSDEIFKDLKYGIRGGSGGYMDAETAVLRCKFFRCSYAGITVENYNALDWQIWDNYFENCYIGITARLENEGGAGNFNAYNNIFYGSVYADVFTAQTEFFCFRGNYTLHGGIFLYAMYSYDNGGPVTLQDNIILDATQRTSIYVGSHGPTTLIGNVVRSRPEFTPGQVVYVRSEQIRSGNIITLAGGIVQEDTDTVLEDTANPTQVVSRATVNPSIPLLQATPAKATRQIFEVASGANNATIQAAITSAHAVANRAVVHLPTGIYNLSGLTVPAGSDIQIIGDGLATDLRSFGGAYAITCANAENLTLDGFHVQGAGEGNGLDLRYPDSTTKLALFESTTSHRANTIGFDITGFAQTRTEMHSAGISGDGVTTGKGVRVTGTGSTSGEVALFTGSSSNCGDMFDVQAGGKLLVQALWYESNTIPTWVRLAGKGTFTANCMKVFASYTPGVAVEVDNFDGIAAFIGVRFNGNFLVEGTGTNTVTGNLAAQCDTPNQYSKTSPNALSASVANRLFTNGVGSASQADIGTVSQAHLAQLIAQLRTVKPLYKERTVGLYVHRVFVENCLTNIRLRPNL